MTIHRGEPETDSTVPFATFSKVERNFVTRIIERFTGFLGHQEEEPLQVRMDLAAIHYHTPLDLAGLLQASDHDFMHDLNGIRDNIDRDTGKLRTYFHPRFALPEEVLP